MTDDALHGVVVRERDSIPNAQGEIRHILRADDAELFRGFGEAYASVTAPDVIKGWHQHDTQWNVLSCVSGNVLLALHDPRATSPTRGKTQEIAFIDGQKHRTVLIPPGVLYSWKNCGVSPAVLINCASHPHGTTVSRKIPLDSVEVPYRWQ